MYQLLILTLFLPSLVYCGSCPQFSPLDVTFNQEDYLGTWYEIARTDVRFENGLDCVVADYSLRDPETIDILNQGRDTNATRKARGTATFTDQANVLQVKFDPRAPAMPYWIVDTDLFGYSVVASCVETPRKTIFDGWILSRTRQMDSSLKERLIVKLEAIGIKRERLTMTNQENC